jgi:hypothetical protein
MVRSSSSRYDNMPALSPFTNGSLPSGTGRLTLAKGRSFAGPQARSIPQRPPSNHVKLMMWMKDLIEAAAALLAVSPAISPAESEQMDSPRPGPGSNKRGIGPWNTSLHALDTP